jgi:FtsH-binding integral membrane protein
MEKTNFRMVIDFACICLAISVVMDAYLWLTTKHWIPSWTMSIMSLGLIILLQVIKREVDLKVS